MTDDLRKKALELELAKRFAEAAELYRKLRLVDKAAFMYQKAGDTNAAVRLFVETGQMARAVELCRKAGMRREAAQLFEKLKDAPNAAAEWLAAGEPMRAAELYAACGRDETAANIMAEHGRFVEAARLYERAKRLAEAADCYAKAPSVEAVLAALPDVHHQRYVAGLLEDAGHLDRAAQLYAASHSLGDAVLAHLKAERIERAAALARLAPDDIAADIADRIPHDGAFYLRAARMFASIQDFRAAAHVCAAHGDMERAGECLEQGGFFVEAAQAFYKARKYVRVAAAFEKGGDFARAAEQYEGAHEYERAALCYEKMGDAAKAQAARAKRGK